MWPPTFNRAIYAAPVDPTNDPNYALCPVIPRNRIRYTAHKKAHVTRETIIVSAGEGTLSHAVALQGTSDLSDMAARKHEGGGTDGGATTAQPLCITYTATQILTLFKQRTPYSVKLVGMRTRRT